MNQSFTSIYLNVPVFIQSLEISQNTFQMKIFLEKYMN